MGILVFNGSRNGRDVSYKNYNVRLIGKIKNEFSIYAEEKCYITFSNYFKFKFFCKYVHKHVHLYISTHKNHYRFSIFIVYLRYCLFLLQQDPMSHRIIEKRRRDRMNNCLADLSRLIPAEYLKKGRGRVEKTEIIEMAIRHMKHLQSLRQGTSQTSIKDNLVVQIPCIHFLNTMSTLFIIDYRSCIQKQSILP